MSVATAKKPSAADRRIAPRRQPTLGTVCQLETRDGDDLGTGLVWNISSTGLSLLLGTCPEPGTFLRGNLHTLDDSASLMVDLRVQHASPIRTGDYVLGVQFEHPLAVEEMSAFLGENGSAAMGT